MRENDLDRLKEMDQRIKSIEEETLHLQSLGEGVPVIEKNVQILLSAVYCLKFGISDVVDSTKQLVSDQ